MKTEEKSKIEKMVVHNLIILDESGSMSDLKQSTVTGCNETINVIKSTQAENAETQDHYVSIYVFQSDSGVASRYLIKNVPIADMNYVEEDDYQPRGLTPLFDAMGVTINDLKAAVKKHENGVGSVTVITDGYENSSREFSGAMIAKEIKALDEEGWNFVFIGANIDVDEMANRLNISNKMAFEASAEGTKGMFGKLRRGQREYMDRVAQVSYRMASECDNLEMFDAEERKFRRNSLLKKASKGFFRK